MTSLRRAWAGPLGAVKPHTDVGPRLRIADRLAAAVLVLAAISAVAGLVVVGLYRDTEEMVRQARAADAVTLMVAVPALGFGLLRARAGSLAGRLLVLAALGYLAYNYAIFGFSVVITAMTPVHLAILGLATWALVLTLFGLDTITVDRAATARLPRRAVGGFLIVVAALFALLWLGEIAGAISSGQLPSSVAELGLPTSAIYALDLAFALPLIALAGWWLLRDERQGRASALAALTWLALMGLSVLAIFAVDAAAGVASASGADALVPAAIFATITGVAALFAIVGFMSLGHTATP